MRRPVLSPIRSVLLSLGRDVIFATSLSHGRIVARGVEGGGSWELGYSIKRRDLFRRTAPAIAEQHDQQTRFPWIIAIGTSTSRARARSHRLHSQVSPTFGWTTLARRRAMG
jgi:hypothetical protein